MRKALWLIAALGSWHGSAVADVLTLPEGPSETSAVHLPAKGSSMGEVEKKYGPPRTKHPTVGGGAPLQPPITRWDYETFTVIFERDRVVDAVIPGEPPRLKRRDGWQQAPLAEAELPDELETPDVDPLDVPENPTEARSGGARSSSPDSSPDQPLAP